ncbi:MAG TPA: hypothetical protein VHZ50_11905 [Puia sp.]|nr:hypothetical protein [Puia sp.]
MKNHVNYIINNSIKEAYDYIVKEIINPERSDHLRSELLKIYYQGTNDINTLKAILQSADSAIKWEIVELLFTANETSFLNEFLLKNLHGSENPSEKLTISNYLIKLQNIEGLKYYVEWIKNNMDKIDIQDRINFNQIFGIEAVPYLIDLLKIGYEKVRINRFDDLTSMAAGALSNIALTNEHNLNEVKSKLSQFIVENERKYENIKYLRVQLNRMDEQFYMNKAKTFTIDQVKNKLKLLEI